MGCPAPPPPPEWMGEKAKQDHIRMLERHLADSPPAWLLVAGIVGVFVLLAGMLWSISGWGQ